MKKKYLSITLALSVALGCFAQPLAVSAATDDEEAQALASLEGLTAGGFYVEENSYIDTENNAFFVTETKQDAAQVIDAYDLDEGVCAISEEIEDCVIVQTDLTDGQAQELEADARVTQVESNYMVYGCTEETGGTVSDEMTQWYLDALNVDENAQGASGKKVKVELLDSGVSYVSALENVNRVDLTEKEEGREGGFSDVLFHDNSGHGTAMAGLIAADAPDGSLTGINPAADLYSVKILDESLQAPVSKAVEGIYWGIENNVDIINMSFGTEVNSEALHNAVKAAADAGILLIAAAGNNAGKGILYPAAYPEVIAVGATTSDGTILSGSATGSELELLAPGSQIISTGMVDGYTAGSGTSLATAEVTGIASLLLAQPGATADMVRGLLGATAKDVDGTDAGLVDYGYAKEHFAEYLAAYQSSEVDETAFENPAVPETYDTEGIVNGLWDTDTHNWLVSNGKGNITTNAYITNMSYAAKAADTSDYHPSDGTYNCLHGLGAYTVSLYTIWKFANYVNRGENDPKKAALGQLSSEQKTLDSDRPYKVANMLDACLNLINKDTTVKENNYNSSNAKKKYLVAGFACHMIGDIYAHRALVPEYVFYGRVEDTEILDKEMARKGFTSRLDKSHFSRWDEMVDTYKTDPSIFTFTQFKNYATIGKFNQLYEDNEDFCRERLDAALECTSEFLRMLSSSTENKPTAKIVRQNPGKYVFLIHYDEYISVKEGK